MLSKSVEKIVKTFWFKVFIVLFLVTFALWYSLSALSFGMDCAVVHENTRRVLSDSLFMGASEVETVNGIIVMEPGLKALYNSSEMILAVPLEVNNAILIGVEYLIKVVGLAIVMFALGYYAKRWIRVAYGLVASIVIAFNILLHMLYLQLFEYVNGNMYRVVNTVSILIVMLLSVALFHPFLEKKSYSKYK